MECPFILPDQHHEENAKHTGNEHPIAELQVQDVDRAQKQDQDSQEFKAVWLQFGGAIDEV